MRLTDWARLRGRGVYTELFRESGVSYKTVLKAAADGEPVVFEIAEKLSRAVYLLETRAVAAGEEPAGLVSIDEIRFPGASDADSTPPPAPAI